jgi:hypothetical protein
MPVYVLGSEGDVLHCIALLGEEKKSYDIISV